MLLERASGADDVRRHRARGLRRLLVDLVHRARDLAAHDRRRGRRASPRLDRAPDAATSSSPGFRSGSASSGSARSGSTTGSSSCANASPRRSRAASGSSSATSSAASSRRASGATSSSSSARRRSRRSASSRGASRSRSAPTARRPSSRAASRSTGSPLTGKIDRIDLDPFSARGIVQDYKSGKTVALGGEDRVGAAAADPALHARPARPRRHRAARRALPRARRRAAGARPPARRGRRRTFPASRRSDYLDEEEFWAQTERAKEHAAAFRRAHPLGRGAARSEGRLPVPDLVRSVVDVPGGEVMTVVEETRTPNEEQLAAIDAGGLVFVSAGAGTGKTTVLVERFVRAVCDRGPAHRLGARDHVHRAGCRRAARTNPAAARRARAPRSRARAGRRVDLDDPRLLPPLAEGASVRGRHRPAFPRARREPGASAGRRGIRAGARGVLRVRRPRADPAARDVSARAGCGGC